MATTGERATGTITIEYNTVTVTPGADGDVWLTPSEIARMFEVFVPTITSNIRAIYKHGALRMSETSNLPTAHAELYNLEMISALAFRVDTPQSAAFRRWLIRRPHSRMVVLKSSLFCSAMATLSRSTLSGYSFTSTPSTSTVPSAGS